jgi:tetratricopeptide (TPR) repeat protein
MHRKFTEIIYGILMLGIMVGMIFTANWVHAQSQAEGKPRLIMVRVQHWKTKFFNLPEELPVLIQAGGTFDPKKRMYDFEEGMEAMEVFLNLKPKDPLAPNFRLFLEKWPLYQEFFKAVDKEEFDQARPLLEHIRKLDPQEPAIHFYWGSLYSQTGEYALAEKEYRLSLDLYPDYGPTYINLARLAMARQSQAEAEKYLQRVLEKNTGPEQGDTRRLAEQMLQSLKKP